MRNDEIYLEPRIILHREARIISVGIIITYPDSVLVWFCFLPIARMASLPTFGKTIGVSKAGEKQMLKGSLCRLEFGSEMWPLGGFGVVFDPDDTKFCELYNRPIDTGSQYVDLSGYF